MTYITHTQQAILGSSANEQSITEAVAPTQDPLTSRDRRIIGEIIQVQPESIRTIWIEGGITVWVQLVGGGRLPFDKDWFATRVAEVKATLAETPRERNERLSDELEKACTVFGLYHGEINWLSFSTKLFQDGHFVGNVWCNQQGWYATTKTVRGESGCWQCKRSDCVVGSPSDSTGLVAGSEKGDGTPKELQSPRS
ncbi:hypothetical protein COO91_08251 [Nostoc flagelliforme CCNUN1]|uniref:Uncharacterized protein n=1 Tax=Nostoc flagelliforme CCNUN1 TaxID=2038116 RepID=A0A2K8T374_9NOSO|nr:hypothetical protein [Nostoc flagelliforme]AUB42144.1 hypothetical protein COO91_08251 [Nostoc flagelliforme CCNUN1]